MIVKVRSHTVYKLKDGRYKCEVWYINENGETVTYYVLSDGDGTEHAFFKTKTENKRVFII